MEVRISNYPISSLNCIMVILAKLVRVDSSANPIWVIFELQPHSRKIDIQFSGVGRTHITNDSTGLCMDAAVLILPCSLWWHALFGCFTNHQSRRACRCSKERISCKQMSWFVTEHMLGKTKKVTGIFLINFVQLVVSLGQDKSDL